MARDTDGIFSEKWADGGDTGEPAGFDRDVGWPLSYSQPGGEYPTRLLYNLLWKEISALAIEINQGGSGLEYNATIDYIAKAIVRGSDGDYYIATAANGPTTAAVDPVGDLTGVWELFYLNSSGYVVTGTANALVLNAISGVNPTALFDGQVFTFKATATNTAAATVQIGALGAQSLTLPGGQALSGEEVVAGKIYNAMYVKASTRLELIIQEPVSRGHIDGLIMSNGTDSDHDIDISIGEAADFTGAYLMKLTAAMTKQIDAAWAAGDNAGGMFTGAVAVDTWYHVYEIRKDSDGSIDFGFDTSLTASNAPAGYSNYRRIGSVLTDGSSNIIEFFQKTNEFLWKNPPLDVNGLAAGTSVNTLTISAPLGVRTEVKINIGLNDNTTSYVKSTDVDDEAPTTTVAPLGTATTTAGGTTFQAKVFTDLASQINYRQLHARTIYVSTIGYKDFRGRDA